MQLVNPDFMFAMLVNGLVLAVCYKLRQYRRLCLFMMFLSGVAVAVLGLDLSSFSFAGMVMTYLLSGVLNAYGYFVFLRQQGLW